MKYFGSLIWRCSVKRYFDIRHNLFQSFASIGRVDLVSLDVLNKQKFLSLLIKYFGFQKIFDLTNLFLGLAMGPPV